MNIEIKLVKKFVKYKDEQGNEKRGTNFYVQIGTTYVPIQVCFFPNDKCEGRDPAYANRVAVLTAISEELPPRPDKPQTNTAPAATVEDGSEPGLPF